MLSPDELEGLRQQVERATGEQKARLDALRADVRALKPRTLYKRQVGAVSFVASQISTERLSFDPVEILLIRVVDSLPNTPALSTDVFSRETDLVALSHAHFERGTALGQLMSALGVASLNELSHMLPKPEEAMDDRAPSWPGVYRELYAWAELFRMVNEPQRTPRLIVVEGQLRSKVFAKNHFMAMWDQLASVCQPGPGRGATFIAGIGQWNNVLDRYQLAFALERTLKQPGPCYVHIPRELEKKASRWTRDLRGRESLGHLKPGEEPPKFVAGDLYLVRFGDRPGDPVWPVDLFHDQAQSDQQVDEILGYLLFDALEGFPILHFPRSLQIAREKARLDDFGIRLLDDTVAGAVRDLLQGDERRILDEVKLTSRRWRFE